MWIVLAWLTVACSGDARRAQSPDAGTVDDAGRDGDSGGGRDGECGFADGVVATIDVGEHGDVVGAGGYAEVGAVLRDGPDPSFHVVTLEEGECRLYELAIGFCDPACSAGETCTATGDCVPYPASISGGTIAVSGLGGHPDPIEMQPQDGSPGTYEGPFVLPADLFGPDDRIVAAVAGDVFDAISFETRGVARLETTLTDAGLQMRGGEDAEVAWTAGPAPGACVQMVLPFRNRSHGLPADAIVRCESPDDGSLTVPRSIVEAFPIGETPERTEGFDWPQSELTRYTRDMRETEHGPAALWVRSTLYFRFHHLK